MVSQIKITGGNYLKKDESYNDLPLTLSVPEVAAVLGISRAGAYELTHSVSFPKAKIGKQIVVPKDKFIRSFSVSRTQLSGLFSKCQWERPW